VPETDDSEADLEPVGVASVPYNSHSMGNRQGHYIPSGDAPLPVRRHLPSNLRKIGRVRVLELLVDDRHFHSEEW